ncbi:cupin domain-containing protein [Desertihabitans aurantiacus]|uniref:cupin domain-containing protein n=1 Tax=Desertihabitans aurantiacus TaxID=2282477 RepID=UPI000DF7FA91|nr:cupin domain-containing protein [Desertihabitans aurantiacus]
MTDLVDRPTTTLSRAEVERRTIRRSDWVPCQAAFIDCRTPGSDRKSNFQFIGPGVSQSSTQFVNLTDPHGFNLGAAGMPNGVSNSLHLHFTAEVFINLGGEFLIRWGVDGTEGEYLCKDGDIISVPTWAFRGFTNVGPDDGILLTILGHDVTGGIIWGPAVLRDAESHGLHLTADNRLIDTVAGDVVPDDVALIKPMPQEQIDALRRWSVEEMRARVMAPGDRRPVEHGLLCGTLPGGGARITPVIGYGMVEDRRAQPLLHEPHTFNVAWLTATPGEGVLSHRHERTQVLVAKSGRWQVHLEDQTVELGPDDMLSVPQGSWRSFHLLSEAGSPAEPGTGELLVVNGGDDRVLLEWAPEVVGAAERSGWVLDPNGYLAPAAVMRTATEDD